MQVGSPSGKQRSAMYTSSTTGLYSPAKTFANIFISFVGAGVLGLPYAFKEAGIVEGTFIMILVAVLSVKAMILLIDSKNFLEQQRTPATERGEDEVSLLSEKSQTDYDYGDVALLTFGPLGWWTVQISLIFAQVGFCCAYLIFIMVNVHDIFPNISQHTVLFCMIVPLGLLVIIRDLKNLAVFSLMADAANVFAYFVVLHFDFTHSAKIGDAWTAVNFQGTPFFLGVAVYCFEGAGMLLSLEASVPKVHRPSFPKLFASAIAVITTLYIAFGVSGYASFGGRTKEIITLNMPEGIFPDMIRLCLCFSLFFTFPVMMFPVTKLLERYFLPNADMSSQNGMRFSLVVMSVLIVLIVPGFTHIMGLIGSSCCMLLGFILPGLIHLRAFKGRLTLSAALMDFVIVSMGITGTMTGTMDTLERIIFAGSQ